MKISSRTAVLCTVLIAATASNSVEASSRKIIRNGRAERKRALIKVNAENEDTHESKQESEEMLEIAEANIARSLMGMSMSMHMSDDGSGSGSGSGSGTGSGGGSGSGGSSGGGSGSSSEDSTGSESGGGSSSEDSEVVDRSGDSTGSGSSSEGDGEDKTDTRPDVISDRSGDETGEDSSGEEPPAQTPLTDGSGLNAPTSQMQDPSGVEEGESSSVSSGNVAFAAIATLAMVAPLLL